MKFQTNTKPLADSLALGIINSNVSNFHKKSCIVQVSANSDTLKINIEASMICTEITLKGSGQGDPATVFVDSLLFKQLISTIDTSTVILEFTENGLIIQSGKSRFTLAKMLDTGEFELKAPATPESSSLSIPIDKSNWKFIKDYQMYAISMAFVHPVYTRVWVGESGDVLVGDFDSSLFTYSKKGNLGTTCLLQDSIINLFTSLPDGAKISKHDRDYIIQYSADSFTYVTQFTPEYEDDENIGSYNANIFLEMMDHPSRYSEVSVATVIKLLSQATLLSTSSEDDIRWTVSDGILTLKNSNIEGNVPIEGSLDLDYALDFKLERLRQVIVNCSDEKIYVSPMMQEDEAAGICIWDKNMTVIVAGIE